MDLETRVQELELARDRLAGQMNELEVKVTALQEAVTSLSERLEALEEGKEKKGKPDDVGRL